ncbi:MAG: zinc-dependent metalloprotease [Bacteroidetes bacterium]|nr:zinc-dependent metalloprotease [Bacteroidota bacterium]
MRRIATIALALTASLNPLLAKKKPTPAPTETKSEAPKAKKTPTLADKTKSCIKMEGLFDLYQDTVTGDLFMAIKPEQLGQEFIHFSYTENGVLAGGHNRGQYRGSRIFTINKYYERVEFEQQNTNFYFDPNSALSKSADANISASLLASEKIVAQDADGTLLVSADELFLTEKLHAVKSGGRRGDEGFSLGNLAKDKTRYESIRNYPANTDLVVRYVFDNPAPKGDGGEEVTDARSVSVLLQHSFIAVPQNSFKPRLDDYRIGFFNEQVNDMTSTDAANYRDLIHRWHLEKKDPTAAVSEPVEPIIWWIENTTPVELRETIRQAALQWNKAFEPLGFKNAVRIEIQPDDADWDAGDIRYNVLRWTSSPNPPFGGYGPSFVNPRTGQILGADIMFEWVFLTNRIKYDDIYSSGDLHNDHQCAAAHQLQMELGLAQAALAAQGADSVEITRLIHESLYYLVQHEMGHTMGLMHNMKASQLNTPAQLKDQAYTNKNSLIGSVMDYPAINYPAAGASPVQYCQTEPGPYDHWAIEYGYSLRPDWADEDQEAKRLEDIARRSIDPKLAFGNDADDMRSPGKAIDPRVMIGDLSNDAVGYAIERMQLTQGLLGNLLPEYLAAHNGIEAPNQSYQDLVSKFGIIWGAYSTQCGVISRYIGGVYVSRAAAGQINAPIPYQPVPEMEQRRAMQALSDYCFAPSAMAVPSDLLAHLQAQRRGFGFFASPEDPKMHKRILAAQEDVLEHLLHPSTLQRLTESRQYGNTYSAQSMTSDLSNAIFAADLGGYPNASRRLLQASYVQTLLDNVYGRKADRYDAIAKGAMLFQINRIRDWMKSNPGKDAETQAHRMWLLEQIAAAQN